MPTAAVALLSGGNLGVLPTLGSLDVHRKHLVLPLLRGWIYLAPEYRVGDEVPQLRCRLVGAKVGHHGLRLLLVLLDRMNLESGAD